MQPILPAMNRDTSFPPEFIWATATAAYQIEGANDTNGRGVSTWDVIRRQPGRIADNSSPSQSCDAYYHVNEDVQLLKELNVTHYRFSICWTRILPSGTLKDVNKNGIAFYRDLLEKLKNNGIEPIVTLFHADYPFELYKQGGWLNRECVQWYLNFCRLCFERFGDLVKYWISFNEISMHAWSGVTKIEGQPHHSPDTLDLSIPRRKVPYVAAHNMLLAHGRAYRMYEKEFKNRQNGSADFCGINYYLTNEVCNGEGSSQMEKDAHFDYLDGRWEKISGEDFWLRYVPEGLLQLLEYIRDNYDNIPVLITENGCADIIGEEAKELDPLCDHHRIRYIKGHIEAVRIALQRGCNVIGYSVWSFLDNFEWSDGFAVKFGLYKVDFDSPLKTRIIKRSGAFLKEFLGQMKDINSGTG